MITALAPMEGVTDSVFRQAIAGLGKRPDRWYTEFTHTEAISHSFNSAPHLPPRLGGSGEGGGMERLLYDKSELPLIAQIWGTEPEKFYQAAIIVKKLGFSGIDINMGCPVRDVVKTGGGGACLKPENRKQISEIIQATKEGGKLPVSVKTRIGFYKIETEDWIGFLLSQDLATLTVHGRLVKDMSKYPANWEEIGKSVKLRNQMKKKTKIIGNGDIDNIQDSRIQESGVDGVMVARGVLHNPWIFSGRTEIGKEERVGALITHVNLWKEAHPDGRNWDTMKKCIKMYISGFPGAVEMRIKLMSAKSAGEMIRWLPEI